MGLVYDEARQAGDAWRLNEGFYKAASNRRERNGGWRWLADIDMRRRHRLAAVFTLTMIVRHAPHRLAALHRLLGSGHTDAIDCIARQSDGKNYDQHAS